MYTLRLKMLKKMYRLLSYKSLCEPEFFPEGGGERARKRRIFLQLPSSATTLDCNFFPSFLYFLKSVVVTVENTERSLARKIVRFDVSLGTGSVFCRIALWDFVTVLSHLHLQLGYSKDSDPKQPNSAMRHITDPVSRGGWPIYLYRRLMDPCMKRSHGTKTTLLAGRQCSRTLLRKVM